MVSVSCVFIDIFQKVMYNIILFSSHRIRSCLQAGRVTLVLGLPWQEGYPGTHTFLLIFNDAFTRQLGSP